MVEEYLYDKYEKTGWPYTALVDLQKVFGKSKEPFTKLREKGIIKPVIGSNKRWLIKLLRDRNGKEIKLD